MSEPTIYALPDEPEGPVWDSNGDRWDTGPSQWLRYGPHGTTSTWGDLLSHRGPVTSTPPWKPEEALSDE